MWPALEVLMQIAGRYFQLEPRAEFSKDIDINAIDRDRITVNIERPVVRVRLELRDGASPHDKRWHSP